MNAVRKTNHTGLTPLQCSCLIIAARYGGLQKTRAGYVGKGATGDDRCRYFSSMTVFALERDGLMAFTAPGVTSELSITAAGRDVEGGAQ